LFKYFEKGEKTGESIDSADVNAYLKEISGSNFTSKNFRTWGGTVSAVEAFEEALKECEENPRKDISVALVKRVAKRLGNTVAVCRSHYIHPCILGCVEDGSLKSSIRRFKTVDRGPYGLRPEEQITLKILKREKEELPEIELIDHKKSA
jgi:DNA topoisomerase-1